MLDLRQMIPIPLFDYPYILMITLMSLVYFEALLTICDTKPVTFTAYKMGQQTQPRTRQRRHACRMAAAAAAHRTCANKATYVSHLELLVMEAVTKSTFPASYIYEPLQSAFFLACPSTGYSSCSVSIIPNSCHSLSEKRHVLHFSGTA